MKTPRERSGRSLIYPHTAKIRLTWGIKYVILVSSDRSLGAARSQIKNQSAKCKTKEVIAAFRDSAILIFDV